MTATITRREIATAVRRFGVRSGAVLMVHTRMSALGHVVGGSGAVVEGLLDALGPEGTLVAYTDWEHGAYDDSDRPPGTADAYRRDPPVFDPATSEAVRAHGRLPERIRTWPGARRSDHPSASVAAIGARAEALTRDHPQDEGYGPDSPLARIVEEGGDVLLLGAPLDTITLLHHAEAIADAPAARRTVRYETGGRVYEEIDTRDGAYPYETLGLGGEDPFAAIARAALALGVGTRGRVGTAECHLFPAAPLVRVAVTWIEERFGRA